MRRSLYALGLVLLFMLPYSSFAQSAEELNERITGSTDTLYLFAVMWKHAYQDAVDGDKKFKVLSKFRNDLEEFVEEQAKIYKQPSGVEGGDSLCAALVALYEFEKTYVVKAFVPFEKLSAGSSEMEISACKDRLTQEGIPERELLSALNRQRRSFAARHGINITPPPAAPKAPYRRPTSFKKKSDQETPGQTAGEEAPAPQPKPRPPVAQKPAPVERPTSSGNPNAKKTPPPDGEGDEGKTPKEKEESEDDD